LGNIAFLLVFGTAASIRFGGATAMAFTVAAGTAANLTTLFVFGDGVYHALGFSGAVFGTLGMLAASRMMEKAKVEKISSFYFWIPLLGASAILGSMGSASGSDLAGHLFGFLWGCAAAWPARAIAERRRARS
jgi:membrane associated rhomboid family serine protease